MHANEPLLTLRSVRIGEYDGAKSRPGVTRRARLVQNKTARATGIAICGDILHG
jgi:hypothetical protein